MSHWRQKLRPSSLTKTNSTLMMTSPKSTQSPQQQVTKRAMSHDGRSVMHAGIWCRLCLHVSNNRFWVLHLPFSINLCCEGEASAAPLLEKNCFSACAALDCFLCRLIFNHVANYSFPLVVLKCLQARYRLKVFYTHAGCTLVALNPFQPIPDLYSLDVIKEYHCAPRPQVFPRSQLSVAGIQPPSAYFSCLGREG